MAKRERYFLSNALLETLVYHIRAFIYFRIALEKPSGFHHPAKIMSIMATQIAAFKCLSIYGLMRFLWFMNKQL